MSTAAKDAGELVRQAKEIIRGYGPAPESTFTLAKELAKHQRLEFAQRLAEHIHTDTRLSASQRTQLFQKWALWTSKNPNEPDDIRHDLALHILDRISTLPDGQPLDRTADQETLGIAGGICKRRWQIDGKRQTLEQALAYYERGVVQGVASDNGYTAINAAFMHDLIAGTERVAVPTAAARSLRQRVLDELLPLADAPAWAGGPLRRNVRWFSETIAEAYFGLERWAEASEWLSAVDWSAVEPWERETTARQFAWLAHIFAPDVLSEVAFQTSAPWRVVREAFGGDATRGAASLFAGKLGLALSGGGFRASFFHIGVLAGLAELDMLRHVEALSCVSGGSILGAHYYLMIRQKLEENTGDDLTRQAYIHLVQDLAEQFLAGVQKNLRTRLIANPIANLKMLFVPGYNRTNRLGELYEKHLYGRIRDDGERRLAELKIWPGKDHNFQPKYDNWRRSCKVPILILNATTVNTGHSWQFTAAWMGEPPNPIDSDVDRNYRLRRMWIKNEAPARHRGIRLGQAVAASSCVPGLFPPLELRNLYETKLSEKERKRITVRLVDGGVHDNQGIFGLLEQNCQVLIVSDASGQMGDIDEPPDNTLSVLLRSNSISMARVRTAQYRELLSRQQSGRLRSLLFMHLKDELPSEDKDWIDCDNPKQLTLEAAKQAQQDLTSYRVLKSLQAKLADVRTDLDSFSKVEAWSLMASGCNMVRTRFPQRIRGFHTDPRLHDWRFLEIDSVLREKGTQPAKYTAQLLSVASRRAFKIWQLSAALKGLAALLVVVALAGLVWIMIAFGDQPLLNVRGLVIAVLAALAGTLGLGLFVRLIQYRKTLNQILTTAALGIFGGVIAWLHLGVFDRLFLRWKENEVLPGRAVQSDEAGGTV